MANDGMVLFTAKRMAELPILHLVGVFVLRSNASQVNDCGDTRLQNKVTFVIVSSKVTCLYSHSAGHPTHSAVSQKQEMIPYRGDNERKRAADQICLGRKKKNEMIRPGLEPETFSVLD